MGELQIISIAKLLSIGVPISLIRNVFGTSWKMTLKEFKSTSTFLNQKESEVIFSYDEIKNSKEKYATTFKKIYENQNPFTGKQLFQPHPKVIIIQNKPMRPLSEKEMDCVYALPYTRNAHPSYNVNSIPCLDLVKHSITTHRGCFGDCSFCSIAQHQGKIISTRSEKSIIEEIKKIVKLPDFKGIINGFGGPSANMYGITCDKWSKYGTCINKNCLYPQVCSSLNTNHKRLINLLNKAKQISGVKKILTGYGVRYDLALCDEKYIEILCKDHVGGQLKIAPESFSDNVTNLMKKQSREVFEKFEKKFEYYNNKYKKNQYLITFLMSGHPGCTLKDSIFTAEYIRDSNHYVEQVQDFTPTPMTLSTCMFYTGINPFTMDKIYVPKTLYEKKTQRALLQYKNHKYRKYIIHALTLENRMDLIGISSKCLLK